MVNKRQLAELKSWMRKYEEWELFEEITGFELQKEQLQIWKDSVRKPNLRIQVILAHRGWGKSWLEGAHRFIKMIKNRAWESYTVYPKREQAMYSLGYTKAFIQGSPYTNWMAKKAINWGETKIMLPNKSFSFIISPSSRTATGYHVDWGYCGEAARWADDWDEIYYSAILPMTNRKEGVIWQTSSAFGERGFFYKEYKKGQTDSREIYCVDVDSSGIYNDEAKQAFKEDLGSMLYRQEYECKFIGSAETFIQLYLINRQSRHIPQAKWADVVQGFQELDYLGLDPGQSFDKFGVVGIKRNIHGDKEIVMYDEVQNEAYELMTNQIKAVQEHNPNIQIFMESTGNQIMYLQWLQSKGINVVGEEFGNNKKQEMYQRLESSLRSGKLYVPINNELCMSQLKYIPYKLKGTHIQFPDENLGGHHALHALVVIDIGLDRRGFRIRSL